jgi:hypothetical protein
MQELQPLALSYAGEVFLSVDFRVADAQIPDEVAFPIFEEIQQQLAAAWLAGYFAATSEPKEAA